MGKIFDVETGAEIIAESQFRNPTNYQLGDFDKDTEVNNEPSMTVPDESFTIQEILEKFTRGVLPDIAMKNAMFDNQEEFDGFEAENPVDITEVEEQLTEVNARLKSSASKSVKAKKSEATTTKEEEANESKPEAKKAEE